jgi:N6-L-threonylcarbamoyladenine synthase
MIVLGIESTCDETAASIVQDGKKILSQVISSQVDLHNIYGGVVPELACRRHIEVIIPVIDEALKNAGCALETVDLIAVANGPGLIGPLFVGLQTAKGIALSLNKPIVGVNHVEAHLYAAIMSENEPITYPALGLVLSGGHTTLVKMDDIGSYKLLGQTVDDAVGEAFDKVAKLLGLPYPGGPHVETLAKKGDPHRFPFKGGVCKANPLNFSFSGLKTAVLYASKEGDVKDPTFSADLCASFQEAAFKDIISKAKRAAREAGASTLIFGGGVTNNQELRRLFAARCPEFRCIWPAPSLSLDNATMIAGLGYHLFQKFGPNDLASLEAKTNIHFSL